MITITRELKFDALDDGVSITVDGVQWFTWDPKLGLRTSTWHMQIITIEERFIIAAQAKRVWLAEAKRISEASIHVTEDGELLTHDELERVKGDVKRAWEAREK